MRFCVIRDTVTVIDGSDNSDEVMLLNANNAGFSTTEVEILAEAEYAARSATIPDPIRPPSMEERIAALEDALLTIL